MSDERAAGKMPPYRITTRDMIRTVAERWWCIYNQHPPESIPHLIGLQLEALDRETATRADIKAIVGNDQWTRLLCSQCGQDTDAVIVVGQEQDWESRTAELCASCMHKAAKLLDEPVPDDAVEEKIAPRCAVLEQAEPTTVRLKDVRARTPSDLDTIADELYALSAPRPNRRAR
jgi:hypothetical protein